MNELFVNIKVDREERPDLDRIYQLAHQLLTRRGGGWPLTMFLDADDQRPFFGGTYFPNEPRYGMPAFRELLRARGAVLPRAAAPSCASRTQALVRGARAHRRRAPADRERARRRARCARCARQLEPAFDRSTAASAARRSFRIPAMIERLLRDWRATARAAASPTCRRCSWPRSR